MVAAGGADEKPDMEMVLLADQNSGLTLCLMLLAALGCEQPKHGPGAS